MSQLPQCGNFVELALSRRLRHWWDKHSCIHEYLSNKLPHLLLFVIFYLTLTVLINFCETLKEIIILPSESDIFSYAVINFLIS